MANVSLYFFRVPLLNSLIGLFELPEDNTPIVAKEELVEDLADYSPAYSQLAHAQKPQHDPLAG